MNRRFVLAILLTGAVMFALAPVSRADTITIWASEDGGPITLLATGTGSAVVTGIPFGTYAFNSISGTGTPPLTEPNLDTSSLNVTASGGSHTLTVYVTEQGISSPTGVANFLSGFTSNDFTGSVTSVQEQTLIDVGNGAHTGTLLDSHTFMGLGSASSVDATPSLTAPFSETAVYTISTTGSASVNDTINISNAPEPSSMLLFGTGLSGVAAMLRRRVKKQ